MHSGEDGICCNWCVGMSGGVWEGWRFVGGAWEGVSYVGGVDVCGRCDGRVRCVGVVKVCGTVL